MRNYIKDYITGKKLRQTPEEKVRQEYSKILFEDYDYAKEQMNIEVPIQRGSNKGQKEKADIVIYYNAKGREQNKDIYAIIETKRRDLKEGVEQLKSYMSATSSLWGVWYNGIDSRYFLKDTKTSKINEIYTIPKASESIYKIGEYSKDKLRPVRNLKPIFNKIFTTLYSNTNISRREKLGSEMIKLIFCKIWDEKYHIHSVPKFLFSSEEERKKDYESCKKRIELLFSDVLKELCVDGIFLENEKITLDAKSVCQVVGELQQFSLMKTEKDIVGEAFEVFAESKLMGEKGEFFTPREIVKTAIQIINPEPEQTIFDPACGSGGFLIYAIDYIWNKTEKSKKYKGSENIKTIKKEVAERTIFGADKEHDLVRIAKAYMSIIGDGKSQIVQENMLHQIKDFQPKSKEILLDGDEEKKFDIIITNPPFGSKVKVSKSDSKYFELGYSWGKNENEVWVKGNEPKETEPQCLYVELCLRFLKNNGTLAIVLPETYFHAPTKKHILSYLSENNNVKAVIDLPHNTFRPYCNAKTILIIIEKAKKQCDEILMAVAEEIGHDHLGKTKYRIDESKLLTSELWDDTENIRNEIINNKRSKYTFYVKKNKIKDQVLVPRYYWKTYMDEIKKICKDKQITLLPVKQLLNENIIEVYRGHGSPKNEYKGEGNIPYVRAGDIGNWAIYKNPVSSIPEHEYLRVKGGKIDLKYKDLVYVKEGSYRVGDVAVILPLDTKVLLNSHCFIIRVLKEKNEYGITPFYLTYLLTHPLVKMQIRNKVFIDTTLPNIGNRWKELLLPIENFKKDEIISKLDKIFKSRIEAEKEIDSIYKTYA